MNGAADRIELFDLSIANGEGKVCFEGWLLVPFDGTLITLDHRASRLCTRMETMNRAMILAVVCALVCPTIVLAQTAETKPVPINDVRKRSPTIVSSKGEFILRQDLFDPNNPNNLRSDWPRPSGQPGPSH
jgi:hypothetical protein